MENNKKVQVTDKIKLTVSAASFDPEHGCGNDPTKIKDKLGEIKIEPGKKIPKDPKRFKK